MEKFLLVPAEGDIDEDEGLTREELLVALRDGCCRQRPFMLAISLYNDYMPHTIYGYGTDPVDAYQTNAPKNATALLSAFEMTEEQYEQMKGNKDD
jgi:hypothetical protein